MAKAGLTPLRTCGLVIAAIACSFACSAHNEEGDGTIGLAMQDKLSLLQTDSAILKKVTKVDDLESRSDEELASAGILDYLLGWARQSAESSEPNLHEEEAEPVTKRRGSWAWATYRNRNRWNRWRHDHFKRSHTGIMKFVGSVTYREWFVFWVTMPLCLAFYVKVMDWPSTRWYHSLALIFWFCGAGIYAALVWMLVGAKASETWISGYALELVFSVENIFIFHIIIEQFRVPRKLAQKAIFVVICFQILFQMACFLGLAWWILSLKVLPYIMGIWLIYVGIQTIREEQHNARYTSLFHVVSACQAVFGRSFVAGYRRDCRVFFHRDDDSSGGRLYVTMLFPVILCLLAVDLIMEVDVTITKIEEIDNHYIAFTSSALAAFAVPELFFVVRDLFHRFYLLKFGITFTLFFFGCELLCNQIVDLPATVGLIVIAIVMFLCVALSQILGYDPREDPKYLGNDTTSDLVEGDEDIIDATEWLRDKGGAENEKSGRAHDEDSNEKAATADSNDKNAPGSWWRSPRSVMSNVGPKKNRSESPKQPKQ